MTPKTDIVISLHADRAHPAEQCFAKCIATLRATTQNYRLILVEDACDDVARKVIEDAARQTQSYLIHTPKQKWFTRAYNRGMRLIRTPWAVLLNADTELGNGWLDELYAVRDDFVKQTNRKVGIVGSVFSAPERRRYVETRKPDYVTAHCWLVSMDAMFDISNRRGQPGWYLNELQQRCIHTWSDVEGSHECNAAGWATIKSFKSHVHHIGGQSWHFNQARIQALKLQDVDD